MEKLGNKIGKQGMGPIAELIEKLESVSLNLLRLEHTIKIDFQLSKEEK